MSQELMTTGEIAKLGKLSAHRIRYALNEKLHVEPIAVNGFFKFYSREQAELAIAEVLKPRTGRGRPVVNNDASNTSEAA